MKFVVHEVHMAHPDEQGQCRGSPGARLRDMGGGNHAITALAVIKRNQVKMIKNS